MDFVLGQQQLIWRSMPAVVFTHLLFWLNEFVNIPIDQREMIIRSIFLPLYHILYMLISKLPFCYTADELFPLQIQVNSH
jgi:hypothetical protein